MTLHQLIQAARNDQPHPLNQFFLNYRPKCLNELRRKYDCKVENGETCYEEAVYQFWKRFVIEKKEPPANKKKAEGYLYMTAKNAYLRSIQKNKPENDELETNEVEAYLINKNRGELSLTKRRLIKAMKIGFGKLDDNCEALIKAKKIQKEKRQEMLEEFTQYKDVKSLSSAIAQCMRKFEKLAQEAYHKLVTNDDDGMEEDEKR